jgi:hypothetical protein
MKARDFTLQECPHCHQLLTTYMCMDYELAYFEPVGICRNDECGYYLRSFRQTDQYGNKVGYRYVWLYVAGEYWPVTTRVTDAAGVWEPITLEEWTKMEQSWIDSKATWEKWEAMYPGQLMEA